MNPIREIRWDRRQSGIVLAALAERPFKDVFEVIGHINEQAHRQFRDHDTTDGIFQLSVEDADLCLEALQDLPYRSVHEAISRIANSARGSDSPGEDP